MVAKTLRSLKPSLPKGRFWRWAFWGGLGCTAAGLIAFAITWSLMSRDADDFLTLFANRPPKTISKVLDRSGDVIGIFYEEHRVIIPYGDIPKAFVNAIIATEDADFWSHGGVSSRGVVRAGWHFVSSFGRRREGASTLTMQLVRTVTAKRQKRLDRKLKEIILARKLEKAYTKKQILEQYTNEVNFGGGRYGIEAAAQFYFGKSAPQLNVEECAMLAGMVQAPEYYQRCIFSREQKARGVVQNRRNIVLRRMVDENYLKEGAARALMDRPIRLARENAQVEDIASYAVEEVRKHLYEKYGRDTVLNGGLEVHTTIDSRWQQAANDAVRKGLKAVDRKRGFRKEDVKFVEDPEKATLPGWGRFFENGDEVRGIILGWQGGVAQVRIAKVTLEVPAAAFAWAGKDIQKVLPRGAKPLFLVKEAGEDGVPKKVELDQEPDVEGALLAADPATGEIRAMVGGYDYKKSRFNRTFQAERQVGSTMKAFVYGTAFTQGKTPATLVQDIPTRFTFGRDIYEPKNYERDYWGPIPIWEALRDSRNVPAVRTLEDVGIDNVIQFARNCGVGGRIQPYPSMALGSSDLTLKDMVRGYGTFANGGKQAPPLFLIKKIVDRNGRVLESYGGKTGEEVIDSMSNYQLVQCLQGVAQRGTGARSNELDWPTAGKTGTTDDHTDAWYIGFSTRVVCGAWVGLDAKKTIYKSGADGARVALPIWIDFMRVALPTTPKEEFPVPEGMEWADIDRLTGAVATSGTEPKDMVRLAFKPGGVPKVASTGDLIEEIKAARDKARVQAYEDRAWGAMPATPLPTEKPVDWKNTEDPNAE